MILAFVVASLLVLVAINYYWHKSIWSPAVAYSLIWFISLLSILLAGSYYYPISNQALFIYFYGACVFSFASLLTSSAFQRNKNFFEREILSNTKVMSTLKFLFFFLLFTLPFFCYSQYLLVENQHPTITSFFPMIRNYSTHNIANPSFLNNALVLSQFVFFAILNEDFSKKMKFFSFLLACIYGIMLGSKLPIITVFLIVFFIYGLQKKMTLRFFIALIILALIFFIIGLFYINLHGGKSHIYENQNMLNLTLGYWLGGIVAFSNFLQSAFVSPDIFYAFKQNLNSLGASFYVDVKNTLYMPYTYINATQNTNVYTIYSFYFQSSFLILTAWIGLLSIILTLLYYKFKHKNENFYLILYSVVAAPAIMLSFHADHFFTNENYILKAIIFYFILYKVIGKRQQGIQK
jgi:oligosaccharide repeat unit polymerase